MTTIARFNADPITRSHTQSLVLFQSKTHITTSNHGPKDSLNMGEYTEYISDGASSSSTSSASDTDSLSSSSSSSSDWDTRTVISTVSTILPSKHYKNNNNENITPVSMFESEQFLIDFNDELDRDITYDLYSLFYPFTNLQSLIFANIYPYINSDYKKYKNMNEEKENEENMNQEFETFEPIKNSNTNMTIAMDWNDMKSVNRIVELIEKLLLSCSSQSGIREAEIYLMFTLPSPFEIIQHLRFGLLNKLCDVHIDRFGRRSYHYKKQKSELHFYNHSKIPSQMFNNNDIIGLSDFIQEDNKNKTEIAKIHYHDNDCVMNAENNQIQWQNFAIHSYLYKRTRNRFPPLPQTHSVSTKNIHEHEKHNRNRKHARGISGINGVKNCNDVNNFSIQKEGFLEKQNGNIVTKQWVKYWCILWNNKMLLYKHKNRKKKDQEPIDIIDLNEIIFPISISFDAINRLFQFKLENNNHKKYYLFRTKSEFQRKSWISNIESMLQYDNFDDNKTSKTNKKKKKKTSDKTESCVVM